jgi:Sulfite oxidase and related enzymes
VRRLSATYLPVLVARVGSGAGAAVTSFLFPGHELAVGAILAVYPLLEALGSFAAGRYAERVRGGEPVHEHGLPRAARPYGPYALAWGADGYNASLPIEALMEETSIIAWAMDGEPLPRKHGAPARLVVPTRYGWKSVKYFGALEVLEEPAPGYWEMQGYSLNADPWLEERFDFGRPQMRGRRTSF